MNIKLLNCHKFLRDKLRSLNLNLYNDASNFVVQNSSEEVVIGGTKFIFSISLDTYPPNNEIVVVAYLERNKFFWSEAHSQGCLFKRNEHASFLSQKQLWDYGY